MVHITSKPANTTRCTDTSEGDIDILDIAVLDVATVTKATHHAANIDGVFRVL